MRLIFNIIAGVCLSVPVGVTLGWNEWYIGAFAAGIFAILYGDKNETTTVDHHNELHSHEYFSSRGGNCARQGNCTGFVKKK